MPQPANVKGHVIKPPRPTRRAYLYALVYLGLPFVAALAAVDAALWLFFAKALGRCYGIGCLLGG